MKASIRSLAAVIRRPPSFEADRVDELVRFATLAPNSHNTQPWRFSYREGVLAIGPDLTRACPVADPDHHHVWVSVGAAAEAVLVAAPTLGFDAALTWTSDGATIALRDAARVDDRRFGALCSRQSARVPFDPTPLDDATVEALTQASSVEDVVLRWIVGAELRAATEAIAAATKVQAEDAGFLEELRDWIRFSPARAIATRDGLAGEATGNPNVPEWLGRRLFRFVATPRALERSLRASLEGTAALVVLSSASDDPIGWMRAGRSLLALLLAAEAAGVRCAFVNQAVEVADARLDFAERFGTSGRRPDVVLRLGRPRVDAPSLAQSLRRSVSDVLVRR